ncbi:unnamed protein product [Paramecium octaurelia]|uniref:Uncharacterized protein n=1 Tax=Paramecium octaurelia TaxID=43137 RepID=A0A8S1TEC5_PAROT|nr:unnamed protein product [Paramecium octaurelia]
MRGRSIHNSQPFQMRSPQRAISPVIQIVPSVPQSMNLDIIINLKMEKVLMSFEIQRLNSVLLDIEKKRIAMKNQNQKLQEREQILLLEISNQKQQINDLQQKEKNSRDQLNSLQRTFSKQENQIRDQLMSDEFKKLQEENILLEQKLSYLLEVNQQQLKNDSMLLQKSGGQLKGKENVLPLSLQAGFENLQSNIMQFRKGNLLQNKYANALTMLSELMSSHHRLIKKYENNEDNNEVELQQIQIYLTSLNQDVEALKQYETPKAVRRILNNQSPTKGRSLSPSMSAGEVFAKIMSHIEHLQLDGNNIPAIIKQISLLNSLVRLKNQDLKLIGTNNKLRSSPIRYSAERLNASVRVLTPVKYVSPIRISPIRSHTFHSTVGIPQKISIIHSSKQEPSQNLHRQGFIDTKRDDLRNILSKVRKGQENTNRLENEKQINQEEQFWKQKYEEEIEKQKRGYSLDSAEYQLMEQIKENQELLSHINLMKNDFLQQELYNEMELKKKQAENNKLMELSDQQEQQQSYLNNQIEDLQQKNLENEKIKQDLLNKLQLNDKEIQRLKNIINQSYLKPYQQDNYQIQLCEPLLIEKNKKQLESEDQQKDKNLELQEKIIELQDELNKINSESTKPRRNYTQKEIVDPEKTIRISQLEQENQKLQAQLKEKELQRKDDLKEFQEMIGNGISQQKVVDLIAEKQKLQEHFRVLQNKVDALQQNLIRLQSELQSKNKELKELEQLQSEQNQPQIQGQMNLMDQINNLEAQLIQAKKQYQELLETSQQNSSPNGLKEKILQQQALIHDQENQINTLSNKIEQEIPILEGQLATANQKIQAAENDILNQDKRYNELLNNKQYLQNQDSQIPNDDLKKLTEKYQELNLQLQQNNRKLEVQQDIQEQLKEEINEKVREYNLAQQIQQIQQDQIKDQQQKINKMIDKEQQLMQEIANLQSKINQQRDINVDNTKQNDQNNRDEIIQIQDYDSALQIKQLQEELNKVINENILKDNECQVLSKLKPENEELRAQQTQLYYQIVQLQNQIHNLESFKPSKQQDNDKQLTFETDPEKTLAISQLQQQNQQLRNQLQEIQNQRQDDLQKFKEINENGADQQHIIELFQSKQNLEQQLRNLQNQLDNALQEQILIQGQLIEKNKQFSEFCSNYNDEDFKKQLENLNQIIQEQQEKLLQSKQQYQELLELTSQNLTPNGQKEKLLQQANQIHEQQQEIQLMHQQLDNEVPKLQGALTEYKQKYNDSQTEIHLLMERYQNLLNQRSQQNQSNEKSYSTKFNNLQDTNLSAQKYDDKNDQTNISDFQDDMNRKTILQEQEIALMHKQQEKVKSELEDLHKQINLKDQEILILKNKLADGNTEFWKEEYTKLATQNKRSSKTSVQESPEQYLIVDLQQKNQKLINQIAEIEAERQEDLRKFQKILENDGTQDNSVVQLFSENQQLQQSKRQMQNQIDDLLSQLKDKKDLQDSKTIQNLANQILELQNQNQLLSKQLHQSKEQYSQLQEQLQANLTPNGLQEKILQNTQIIHQQQEQILALQNQIQTDIPEVTHQLQEADQNLKKALDEARNWKEKYLNLLEIKQEIPKIQIDDNIIKQMNLEESQDYIQTLVKNYQKANEQEQQAKIIIDEQKKLINQYENQIEAQHQQNSDISKENAILNKLTETQNSQIEKLNKSNQAQSLEMIDLKNQQRQEQYWKNEYQKLALKYGEDISNKSPNQEDLLNQIDENIQVESINELKNQNDLLQQQLIDQTEELKLTKIKFQEQLLQAQRQINDLLNSQIPQPTEQQESIQFQNDPQKALQLSQLRQQNQSLNKQIEELEQTRRKDLQKFQDMIENGINENQILSLQKEKQELQSELRVSQNKIDNLQQEQLILQSQLTQKTKQLIDIHDQIQLDEAKNVQLQLQNENDLLKKQLDKIKEQYQELLQLQSENLTPNGLQEKILQQTQYIHDLEEQVQNLQHQVETQIPQLSGEIVELKLRLKDAITDAQLWNNKYNEVIQLQQERSEDQLEKLQSQIAEKDEKIEQQKLKFNQLLQEQINQLSPSSAQAKLLKAFQQINDLEERLQAVEDLKNQYQRQLINVNQSNEILDELQEYKQKLEMQEKVNQVQDSQITFYKGQLSQQNQTLSNQQMMDQLENEKQKSQFWKQQYSEMIKQKEPQGDLSQIIKQKEGELVQQFKQPQDQNTQAFLNEIEDLKKQNIYLQQLIINTQSKLKTQEQKEQFQEEYPQDQEKQNLGLQNQALAKQVEELKKINQDILQQMNKALSGDDKSQQISELLQKNTLLSLANSKLLIDLEANQKELFKQGQQQQQSSEMIKILDRSDMPDDKQRIADLQSQIELAGQQIDFWKQKYQTVLNDFSQQHSPTSLQKQLIDQVSQIHQQEEALFILQQTTDKVKQQNENQINSLQREIEIMQDQNDQLQRKLMSEQDICQQLSQQRMQQQEVNEKQIKFWKDKYENNLKINHENPEKAQTILKQAEEEAQNLIVDQELTQINMNLELIDRLRLENQKSQDEIKLYKKRVLELEQQQQKIEPSQQDTIQSRQYQITQMERDLQKAIQNQEFWQQKYNDVVQQNIDKEIGQQGDVQNSASYWRQKYDQAEQSRQELIQKITEKEKQLEQNMQSFQSMLKDELKEELTKIRSQEKQKIPEQTVSESNLLQKLKEQHENEKQQLIQEFLRRIDQLLISNVQKYPEGENWKELILKYEKQRQNELYELKQQLQILQRSQIQTQDIEFYAERRVYENTINELKSRIQYDDQQELFDTIEYQRKVIQGLEDQISFLSNQKLHLNQHIQELNDEIEMLRDNLLKYQLQSDNRKKQRLEVLEAISEMKRERTRERDSQKSPFQSMRPSQNKQSQDRYPRDYLRPSNIPQQFSSFKEHNSPNQRIPYPSIQFISSQQENREIPQKLQELEEVKNKYQTALNNILKLETQVVEKLQQDDIIIQ